MRLKSFLIFSLISFVSACGGNGYGSGQIDYSSATVVEDLTTQLAALDPNISVQSNGDGTINLARGGYTLVIQPGQSSSAIIDFSGRLYNVQVSASGKYTYSPVASPSSTTAYITSAKSLISDLDDVTSKLGLDAVTGVVDLTTGTKNSSPSSVPGIVTLSGTGTSTFSGSISGVVVSGTETASQTLTITHNLADDTVQAAQSAGWDGTGVNVTVLDKKLDPAWIDPYTISRNISGTLTFTDGATTEVITLNPSGFATLSTIDISHGEIVEAFATGLDWKAAVQSAFSTEIESDCSTYGQTVTTGQLKIETNYQFQSNYCGKIGGAVGANADFKELGVDASWDGLIKEKNNSGRIEILNYSFGHSANNTPLNFSDNNNVVIVKSAGNDSEPPNGYDIFGDGKDIDGSSDALENISIALIESDFSNNMIVVGALDSNDDIANYSTIAGSSYDGSSFAFLVDDGTLTLTYQSKSEFSGNLSFTQNGTTVIGNVEAVIYDTLPITQFGTSLAAPRVTGKMAITAQKFPNLNAEQLVNLAKYTATDLGDSGVDRIYGHGKINLTGMLSPIGRLK